MALSETSRLLQSLLNGVPIIPVIAIDDAADAIPMAEAFVEGGLPVLEITLRTDAALSAIKTVKENVPGAIVGAGTVLSADQADACVDAGSEFIVTPGLTEKLARHVMATSVPLLPGVATASEIMQGLELGLDFFKFFPAEINGGAAAIKAFAGPFKEVIFCPTGGVREENLKDYLSLSNVAVVGGTWLVPKEPTSDQKWQTVRSNAAKARALAAQGA